MLVVRHNKKVISSLNEQAGNAVSSRWIKSNGEDVDMDLVVTAMDAAIQDLAIHFPSIERVIKHKDILYTDDPRIRTMATDGISFFANPAFVEDLVNKYDIVGLEFVLIHESLHILFDHCYKASQSRDKYSDDYKVNAAQDYEINFIIENFMKEGSGSAPFKGITDKMGFLYNEEYGKKGLTWEEIYEILPLIKREKNKKKTSDEWKAGFLQGYNEKLEELRKQNLVEHYEV